MNHEVMKDMKRFIKVFFAVLGFFAPLCGTAVTYAVRNPPIYVPQQQLLHEICRYFYNITLHPYGKHPYFIHYSTGKNF